MISIIKDNKKNRAFGIKLWSVLFWLTVWQLASIFIGNDILLVSPIQVVQRLGQLVFIKSFWHSILFSLLRISSGFMFAVCLGIIFAILSYRFKYIKDLLAPLMLATKTVPVASFIILALIWFSSRNLAVLISFLMVLPIIYVNVLEGICSADKQLLEMAQVFNIPILRLIRYVYVPQVIKFFKSACTVSLGLCWKSGIAAEVIGMPIGSIGERLQQAKVYLNTTDLFAWTLVIVLISLLFEKFVLFLIEIITKRLEKI